MALFDLSGIVGMLSTCTVTVIRVTDPTFVSGIATAAGTTTVTIDRCSVQPIAGADLRRLPEGSNDSEWVTVFMPVDSSANPNDFVKVGNRLSVPNWRGGSAALFQIEKLQAWPNVANYTKVIARALNAQEPRLS